MNTRARLALVASLPIVALFCLLIFAPPDGLERASLAQFFGHFHPLAVHMPIALLLLVPLMEIAGVNERRRHIHAAAAFVLGLVLIAAIVTPLLGWLLAWSAGYEGALVTRHMWGGASLAAACWLTWLLRGHSGRLYAIALVATVGLMAWTGYRGGQLAHGEEHLTQHMPQALRSLFGLPAIPGDGAPDGDPATFYGARVAPILREHCLQCHSAEKHRGGLRLGTYASLMHGGKDGPVIVAGNAMASELHRRISLPAGAKDVMPAEGKPHLSAAEIRLLDLWIAAGASASLPRDAIAGAPHIMGPEPPSAPDYRPQQQQIASLEAALGIQLVPRSQVPTDGLILRTASFPARANDAAIARLVPLGPFIVDAELARTAITDAALKSLASFANLRRLDLSYTAITADGLHALVALKRLETLNLTGTAANAAAVAGLRSNPALEHVYLFQTPAAD
ncbi:MAG TPA: c-type cytochrome domain-containing protein [Steroidobacteraceae bacterium]|nr:c-type cytochrome domain-containing protein [Steroidobacteraceae bacterium]